MVITKKLSVPASELSCGLVSRRLLPPAKLLAHPDDCQQGETDVFKNPGHFERVKRASSQ